LTTREKKTTQVPSQERKKKGGNHWKKKKRKKKKTVRVGLPTGKVVVSLSPRAQKKSKRRGRGTSLQYHPDNAELPSGAAGQGEINCNREKGKRQLRNGHCSLKKNKGKANGSVDSRVT